MAKEIIDVRSSHVEGGKCDICGNEISKGELSHIAILKDGPAYADLGGVCKPCLSDVESPDYCDDEDCNTLANAGYGTDEDYEYFENDDY